jgi:hypothetical protein
MMLASIVTHSQQQLVSEGGRTPAPRLTVRVFNYAQVPLRRKVLARRLPLAFSTEPESRQVGLIALFLRRENIRSRTVMNLQRLRFLTCGSHRMPSHNRAIRQPDPGHRCPAEKGTAAAAGVFYDRVEKLARGDAASTAMILGHAMAHELGHLLLGTNSHSRHGLMKAQWNRRDLQLASAGDLDFMAHQALSLRDETVRRSRQQNRLPAKIQQTPRAAGRSAATVCQTSAATGQGGKRVGFVGSIRFRDGIVESPQRSSSLCPVASFCRETQR